MRNIIGFYSMQKDKALMKTAFASAIAVVFLLAFFSSLTYGQIDVETRAAATSQALVNGHVAWRSKLSSPGASFR